MSKFNIFVESQLGRPMGLVETVVIKELGPIEAKVDSGNGAYNVLHGVGIHQRGGNTVTFTTVNNSQITKSIVDTIDINIGSGNIETRPVVEFDIQIGDDQFPKERFSIADRTDNEYKILIGKDFITKLGGLIDVTKQNCY